MQTSYSVNPAKALEGLTEGARLTRPGSLPYLPQISTITLALAEAGNLTVKIVDDLTQQSYSVTAAISSIDEAVALDELVAAWRADVEANALFSVAEDGATVFTATARHANRSYTITTTPPGAMTATVATSQAAGGSGLEMGRMVARGSNDGEIRALTSTDTVSTVAGILIRTDANHFHKLENELPSDVDALARGKTYPVLYDGFIWVHCETAVTPSSTVHVRKSGSGEVGAFRASASGADTIDVSSICTFETTAAAGALAKLRIRK